VEQHADLVEGRAKIADELWSGGFREAVGGLAFDDHSVVDHHVDALPRDELALVVDRDHHFSVNFVSAERELVSSAPL
jgi:hypothetical protein